MQAITSTIPNAMEKMYLNLNSFSPSSSIKRFIIDDDAKLINIETTVKVNPENVAPQVINEFKMNSRLGTLTLQGKALFKYREIDMIKKRGIHFSIFSKIFFIIMPLIFSNYALNDIVPCTQ